MLSPPLSIAKTTRAASDPAEPGSAVIDPDDAERRAAQQALAASLAEIIETVLSARKFASRGLA